MYMTIEKHTENFKRYIPLIGGEFNAEMGPGHGNECISVADTHSTRETKEVTG